MPTDRAGRVLLYSHDSYGLGHLRRSLLIAERTAALPASPDVLVVTGSPCTQWFPVPGGVDTVKLPAATKADDGGYRSRTLGASLDDLIEIRSAVLAAAVRSFRPDVVVVDHAPAGLRGELRPILEDLHRSSPRPALVLGLRDIVDEATRVRAEWTRDGVWPLLDLYDRVLVYGDERVGTTATELGLCDLLPGRVHHTGFLARPSLLQLVRTPPRTDEPIVVVSAGGGGDGGRLLTAYAALLASLPEPAGFRSVVVTGPLLDEHTRREAVLALASTGHDVEITEFTPRMDDLVAGAAALISMAGYNTVVEAMTAGTPALLVPREAPRREQAVRAARLAAAVPTIEHCPIDELGTARLSRFITAAITRAPSSRPTIALDGLDVAVGHVADLLAAAGATPEGGLVAGACR